MNLDQTYNIKVDKAYIIRIDGNDTSEKMAARCAHTCEQVGQPYEFFSAVDGTGDEIVVPDSSKHPFLDLIKHTNTALTQTEVACMLSHLLLWVKCIELDHPIVILEHDAVMVQHYQEHPFFNIIAYLGCIEQASGRFTPQLPMPPHGQVNKNFRFILRAHAYAVDPMICRNLVSKILKLGIYTSADVMMRIDEFAVIQPGVFAYDAPGETTIKGRDEGEQLDEDVIKARYRAVCS